MEAGVGQAGSVGELHRDLDGAVVRVGGEAWCITLYAARLLEGRQWVQLLLVGDTTFAITLRLRCAAVEEDVLAVLADWLAQNDDHADSVVSVARIEFDRRDSVTARLVASVVWSSQVH